MPFLKNVKSILYLFHSEIGESQSVLRAADFTKTVHKK